MTTITATFTDQQCATLSGLRANTLRHLTITEDDWANAAYRRELRRAIAAGSSLQSVTAKKVGLQPESAFWFIDALKEHRGLTALDLEANNINDRAARSIAELSSLITLNVAGNDIGAQGASAIAANLPKLAALNIARNPIGKDGVKVILEQSRTLKALNIEGSCFSSDNALNNTLKNIVGIFPNLTALNIAYNGINKDGAKAIVEKFPNLIALNASWNYEGIGTEGLTAIAEDLPSLKALNLKQTWMDDVAAAAIADGPAKLTALDVSENLNLTEVGKEALRKKMGDRPIDSCPDVMQFFDATPAVAVAPELQGWSSRIDTTLGGGQRYEPGADGGWERG